MTGHQTQKPEFHVSIIFKNIGLGSAILRSNIGERLPPGQELETSSEEETVIENPEDIDFGPEGSTTQ
jgi:hypothetical protein